MLHNSNNDKYILFCWGVILIRIGILMRSILHNLKYTYQNAPFMVASNVQAGSDYFAAQYNAQSLSVSAIGLIRCYN